MNTKIKEYYQYLLNNINKMNWKAIPDFEGLYEKSDWGLTKSLNRLIRNSDISYRIINGIILRVGLNLNNNNGRLSVRLSKDGVAKHHYIHRLVLETFVGPRPKGMEACHKDDNPWNNRVDNLRWDTPKNNQADKIKHGTDARGEKSINSKLNWEQINEIRELYKNKIYYQYELANIYNVSQMEICRIINNKRGVIY
jgi:hypothetical protein